MTEMTFDLADVERLAATLDVLCVGLDDKDRATLHAVFALAGQAVAGENEDEVSGFSLQSTGGDGSPGAIIFVGGILSGGVFDSFSLGLVRKQG